MGTMVKGVVILVLLLHGAGHIMGFMAAWTAVPVGFSDRPWLFSDGITVTGPVGKAFSMLWLLAMIGSMGAGLGLLLRQEWWPGLAIVSSVLSLMVFIPWWNSAPPGSAVGAVLVDLALIVSLALPWGDRVVEFLR